MNWKIVTMSAHNQESTNTTLQKIEARSQRIWDLVQWSEETNQITFVTNEAEEALLDAYFAERKERQVPADSNAESEPQRYTVISGDNLTKIANKYDGVEIADIAAANPNEVGSAPNYNINLGTELTIPSLIPMVTEVYYEEINQGTLGNDAYIVVRGSALSGLEVSVEILEKSPFLLMGSETPLTVIQYDPFDGNAPKETENKMQLKAKFNDEGEAIIKIKFRPKVEDPDTVYLGWLQRFKHVVETTHIENTAVETSIRPQARPANLDTSITPTEHSFRSIINYLKLNVKVQGNNEFYEKLYPALENGTHFELHNEIAPWMEIAFTELGVHESNTTAGANRVRTFHRDGSGQNLGPDQPWCASFANWALIETNRTRGTNYSVVELNPAWSFNWINPERYPGARLLSPDTKPPYGAVLLEKSTVSGSTNGHIGFVVDYVKSGDQITLKILGGNQQDNVEVNDFIYTKVDEIYYRYKNGRRIRTLENFILPQEYIYNENNQSYYQYRSNEPSTPIGTT